MKIGYLQFGIHGHNKFWYKYLFLKRLTLRKPDRPAIYKWLCFYIGYDTKTYRKHIE